MNEPVLSQISPSPGQPGRQKAGCGAAILYAILLGWVTLAVMAASVANWVIEQGSFTGEISLPGVRWAVILAAGLAIFLPCLLLALALKSTPISAPLRAWALGGVFVLLLFPSYFPAIQDFQLTMLLKLAGMGGYLLVLLAWQRLAKIVLRPAAWNGMWLALLCSGLLAIPWLFDGALGSFTDTLLALLVALLFGLSVTLTLDLTLYPFETGEINHGRLWFHALTTTVLAGIMMGGIAESGNQGVLLLSVPLIGLAAAALNIYASLSRLASQRFPAALLVGAALFWPLAMLDPDELMYAIAGGSGDIMQLSIKMTACALGLVLVLGLALLVLQHPMRKAPGVLLPGWLAALIISLAAGLVYLFAGQPGFYGEHLFVILKDQADVSSAARITDYPQRRAYVYQTLVSHANQSQAGLRQTLDRLGVRYTSYYLVDALEVDGGPMIQAWLNTRPEVDRILPNPHLRPLAHPLPVNTGDMTASEINTWNLKMIHADQVVSQLNVNGRGVIVGQSDSGVDAAHAALSAQYRGRQQGNDYNWYDPWYHTTTPTDLDGHGTHTLGTILGKNVGVAPGAQWIGCANLARNLGNPGFYLDCLQFMLAPFPQQGSPLKDGDPARGAMVLNNSWGCPDVEGCDANVLLPAVRALRSAGVFVVASAGNDGLSGCSSVKDPIALYGEVYSVGAVGVAGDLAGFSSLGPVTVDGSNRVKPDILAPGEGVFSSFPHNTYAVESGTSMAGPHVVGVVALMWSANPKLIGNVERTTQILNATAQPYHGQMPKCVPGTSTPNNAAGYGSVDAYAAVKAALEVK